MSSILQSKNGIGIQGNDNESSGMSLLTGQPIRKVIRWEAITQAVDPHSKAKIRVWRDQDEIPVYNDLEVQLVVQKIPGSASMQEVFDVMSSIPGVSRVELTDPDGNGAVAHFATEE